LKHGAASPAWRPDSRALLVTSSIPASELEGEPSYPHERPGRDWRDYDHRLPGDDSKDPAPASPDGDLRAVRNWLEKNAADADPVVLTRLAFQEELALRKEDRFSHIFSLDLEGDAEPVQLTRGFHNHTDPQWDPRSRFIVFVTDSVADVHPDRVRRTAIFRVRPDGTGVESWLNDSGLILTSPRFNGNGTGITCVATEFEDRIYKQSYLLFVLVDRPGWFNTVEGWDSHASNPRWFDLETLLFTTPHHGADHIMRTDAGVRDDELERITAGPVSTLAYDTKAGVIVAALATPQNPCELFLLPDGAPPRRLTDLHHSWLESKELAAFEEHWIDRPDGERVQYWTVKPPAAAGAAPHPVILAIHGGPMAMWGPSEPTMWHEWQLQAAWGYAIVFANPRGSSGYGYDFQRGNHQNWGPGPTGDVLASLDDAIQNNNWIDADRQFITGGSYAGYLTAWIIAHTDRFRAAVAQRGVYDLITFFGEGNAWRLAPEAFGGFPWEPAVRRILSAESPFTYVDQITTPFLIMHGSNDLRTGVTQSEMMYRALKELERPVEYVRYPGAGHDLSRTGKPAQRLDRLMRIIEFFERYDRPATGSSAAN
ncbi:MAG: prolyl oligopeptidase family serine peptidase, partial [Planctomycetota bacterium]|nr:prolyl oligopeptidase family serine peptidase [Planctomycetota bacterium]